MNKKLKTEFSATFIALLIVVVLCIPLCSLKLINRTEQQHVINEISKIQEVSGSDGNVSTTTYYLVHTDKGTFKIEMAGLNAAPYCAGIIHEGDTLNLITRGVLFPLFGLYPYIIAVNE
ncbi:MAG: hypothetical protein IK114_14165 [Fibrobacter sp.]|nr:hypothetical protein [Fibrobacter sp.]